MQAPQEGKKTVGSAMALACQNSRGGDQRATLGLKGWGAVLTGPKRGPQHRPHLLVQPPPLAWALGSYLFSGQTSWGFHSGQGGQRGEWGRERTWLFNS